MFEGGGGCGLVLGPRFACPSGLCGGTNQLVLPVLLWGQVGRGLAAVHDLPSSYSFTPLIVLLLLNASRNKHNLKN